MTSVQTTAAPHDPYETTYQLKSVSVTAPKQFALRAVVEAHADVLAPLCGPGVDLERIIAQLWVASRRDAKLLSATPQSIIPAISRALEIGAVIGRDVHLLMFGQEVTDCLDYKFLVELVIAAGGARSIDARIVCEGDLFRETLGTTPSLVHEPPKFGTPRGRMIGAYAVAHLGQSTPPKFVTMTLAEVEAIRKTSKSWGPTKLKECPEWYAAKTAVRRLVKLLPKNAKLASVLHRIDAAESAHESIEDAEYVTIPPDDAPMRPATVDVDGVDLSAEDEAPGASPLALAMAHMIKGQALDDMDSERLEKLGAWAVSKNKMDLAQMCKLVLDNRALLDDEWPA